jgi:hypothetical protein
MDAQEKDIRAFVKECTQLRRLIQDNSKLSEEQYRYLRAHLETLLTDLAVYRHRVVNRMA